MLICVSGGLLCRPIYKEKWFFWLCFIKSGGQSSLVSPLAAVGVCSPGNRRQMLRAHLKVRCAGTAGLVAGVRYDALMLF